MQTPPLWIANREPLSQSRDLITLRGIKVGDFKHSGDDTVSFDLLVVEIQLFMKLLTTVVSAAGYQDGGSASQAGTC